MEKLDLIKILNRENEKNKILDFLKNFDYNNKNITTKKGLYLYGESGIGKTFFLMNILKEHNYDVIVYNSCDLRNKTIIEMITKHNVSDKSVMSLFNKNAKKIVIIMDELDNMINGDKGGITSLIKLIRPKKTKKQKLETFTYNPIICVGNYYTDKKIIELMKVCYNIELKKPTEFQINKIIDELMSFDDMEIKKELINYIDGDLNKLKNIYDIYLKNKNILSLHILKNIFQKKNNNDNIKSITKNLLNNNYTIDKHSTIMNETDRTIIGLLWHENIVDLIESIDKKISIPFYLNVLDNICFSDYIDRITFQKQIWQFNEMSSLIKTFKNNKLFHDTFNDKKKYKNEVRFTKVLTKYSTQFNNECFIKYLCQQLMIDKKDLFSLFLKIKEKYNNVFDILPLFENYEISKLDINRIFRYLDKCVNDTNTISEMSDINELNYINNFNENIDFSNSNDDDL